MHEDLAGLVQLSSTQLVSDLALDLASDPLSGQLRQTVPAAVLPEQILQKGPLISAIDHSLQR